MLFRSPGNGNFLYSAFYTFSNDDLMSLIETLGVKLKVERGNRVFPQSDKSSDIIKAFEKYLNKLEVNIMLNTKVDDVIIDGGCIKGVICKDTVLPCDTVIVSTGGKSYPLTGSTGDGYIFAQKAGHSIEKIRPSLVPLVIQESWIESLQGLSLKNISISILHKSKIIYEDFGEMIFTHFGVSGPIILSASRFIVDMLPGDIKLSINLKPGLTPEQLDKRIQKDFEKYSRKLFKNSLDDLLPQKLIPVIISLSNIDENREVNKITRGERLHLTSLIRELTFTVKGTRPINEAIIDRKSVV